MKTGVTGDARERARAAPVCVIDGDRGVRESIGVLLGTLGLGVLPFPKPSVFLDWLENGRPGLLITEIAFPEMNGFDLKEALDARGLCIPVIGLTEELTGANETRAAKCGFLALIEKPFVSELVLERVQEALALTPPPTR